MNISLALQFLFPGIDLLSDVTIGSSGGTETILSWRRPEPQPTPEQLEAAWVTVQAQAAQLAALRAGLLATWDQTFTPGEQAFLRPIYDAAVVRFDAGDVAGAKQIIETAPSISTDLDAKKAAIVALFPEE